MRKALVLVMFLRLGMFSKSFPQERKLNLELSTGIRPLLLNGNNRFGERFSYYDKYDIVPPSGPLGGVNEFYGVGTAPLLMKTERRLAASGRVVYGRKNRGLRFGVSGSYFNFDSKGSTRIISPPSDDENVYVNGCRQFGSSVMPVINELESRGRFPFSPVDCGGRNSFKLWDAEAFVLMPVAGKDDELNLRAGLKILNVRDQLHIFQKQKAFVYGYFRKAIPSEHFQNDISLTTDSRSSGWFTGPAFGIELRRKLNKNFLAEILFGEALAIGRVNESGNWRDVDDTVRLRGFAPGPFITISKYYAEGNVPFEEAANALASVTDLELKIKYHVSDRVSLGLGYRSLLISGARLAREFIVPGQWSVLSGSSWQPKERNLFLGGLSVHVAFNINK